MLVRGFRGATTVDANTRDAILDATAELLEALVQANDIERDHVASIIFTTTPDLNAEFPAVAARNAGWTDIALMCGHEMSVPGSLQRCVRILMHVNTELAADQVKHIYLREATRLRPDLAALNKTTQNNGGNPQ
jgi:chorismate mutase